MGSLGDAGKLQLATSDHKPQGYQVDNPVAGSATGLGSQISGPHQLRWIAADTQRLAGKQRLTAHADSPSLPVPCANGSSDSLCETRGSPGSETEQPDASQGDQNVVPAATADLRTRPANQVQMVSQQTDCKPPSQATASSQSTEMLQQCGTNDQGCEAGLSLNDAEQRKQHRRTANRESARKTRERRLHACSRLEAEVAEAARANIELRHRLATAEAEQQLGSELLRIFLERLTALRRSNSDVAAQIVSKSRSQEDNCHPEMMQYQEQQQASANDIRSAVQNFGVQLELSAQPPQAVDRCQPSYANASQQQPSSRHNDWSQHSQAFEIPLQGSLPIMASEPCSSHDTLPGAAPARPGVANLDSSAVTPAFMQTAAEPAQSAFAASSGSACTAAVLSAANSEESAATMLRNSSLTLSGGLSAMLELLYNSDNSNSTNNNAEGLMQGPR